MHKEHAISESMNVYGCDRKGKDGKIIFHHLFSALIYRNLNRELTQRVFCCFALPLVKEKYRT